MCGFVACFHPSGSDVPPGALERMVQAIRHRGPDDEGLHRFSFQRGLSLPQKSGAAAVEPMEGGFGFARLSIQDLSQAGHQPMSSADGRIILVFNGEIYNAASHRESLSREGVTFHGHSDTEVILRLYEKHGWDGLLQRLEGMFAIAIADLRSGSLHAARDHFGIKPLYWWQRDGVLLLASEIKAFLEHPSFHPELEGAHVPEQLLFRYTAWDRTLLRGVRQLPPGHALHWRPGEAAQVRRYWSLPDAEPADASDHAGEIRQLLRSAVRAQMVSDVPLGTQLSGGIDSSLVTLDAAAAAAERLHTFSIVFEDEQVSEDRWMDQAARRAGVHSHRYLFSPQNFAADFAHVTWHLDGPPANPNTLALHLLASQARHTVKVLLTGEGCDELFAGYNRFFYSALQQRHARAFRLAAPLVRSSKGRLRRFLGGADASLDHQILLGSAYGAAGWVSSLWPEAGPEAALAARLEHLRSLPGSGLARQIRYEAETYLPDLLLRQDKMTMAHGIECRVPFLDLKLAQGARALPERWLAGPAYGPNARMRGTKRVIKEIARREFGTAFAMRRKRGFDVPLTAFFNQKDVRERMEGEWLPGLRRRGFLAAKVVDELWRGLQRGEDAAARAEALWVAVGLEIWAGQVLDFKKTPPKCLEIL